MRKLCRKSCEINDLKPNPGYFQNPGDTSGYPDPGTTWDYPELHPCIGISISIYRLYRYFLLQIPIISVFPAANTDYIGFSGQIYRLYRYFLNDISVISIFSKRHIGYIDISITTYRLYRYFQKDISIIDIQPIPMIISVISVISISDTQP